MIDKLPPRSLCATYIAEIRRLYGDEIADKSKVYFVRGFYYTTVAVLEGGIAAVPTSRPNRWRRKQVVQAILNLRKLKEKPPMPPEKRELN